MIVFNYFKFDLYLPKTVPNPKHTLKCKQITKFLSLDLKFYQSIKKVSGY